MNDSDLINLLCSDQQKDWHKAATYIWQNYREETLRHVAYKFKALDEHGRSQTFNDALLALRQYSKKDTVIDYSGGNTVTKLLKTIYYRKILKHLKSTKKSTSGGDLETALINEPGKIVLIDQVLEEVEAYQETQRLISRLSEKCQEFINLFYLEGLSLKEICQKLEAEYISAKTQKSRCLKKLKEMALNHALLKDYVKTKQT